jgi:mRNA interferase RelE/StbE
VTKCTVELTSAAVRSLDRLPPRVLPAVVEFLYGPLADSPERVGTSLRGDFEGLHSAHRGEYRILYEIRPRAAKVIVHRVAHRANAYRADPR